MSRQYRAVVGFVLCSTLFLLAGCDPAPDPLGDPEKVIAETGKFFVARQERKVAAARWRYEVSGKRLDHTGKKVGAGWRATYDLALALTRLEQYRRLQRNVEQNSTGPVGEEATELIEKCQALASTDEEKRLSKALATRVEPQAPIGQRR